MDALRTLAASLGAGQIGVLHERGVGNHGYGLNVDNPGYGGIGASLSQSTKVCWDPTPWRSDSTYRVNNASGYPTGSTSIAVDTGTDPIIAEMLVNFSGVPGHYSIVTGIPNGGPGIIVITPGLQGPLSDNAVVLITKRGERFIYWGHSHTAQSNSWPGWTIYEVADDKWKSPSYYRHFEVIDPDPYLEDLFYGHHHQNMGIAFNPAKQKFYRILPGANPNVTCECDTSPYNPLDIGKLVPFALSGTLTFTTNSKTVTGSGTSFTTQLAPGYQIWRDGDELYNGISTRIVTVASIESDTSLTLVNQYKGSASPGASSAHNPNGLKTHWGFAPGAVLTGLGARTPTEYWPERDSQVWMDPRSGQIAKIYERRVGRGDSAGWTLLYQYPEFDTVSNAGDAAVLHYNTKRRSILVGTGIRDVNDGDLGLRLWELRCNLNDPLAGTSLVALDNMPLAIYPATPTGGLIFHDPITGKYLFISADFGPGYPNNNYKFGEIDASKPLGQQWTELDGSVFPNTLSYDIFGKTTTNCAVGVAASIGVIVFMGANFVHIYKHTANNWASNGMTSLEKEAALPGLVGYAAFGNGFQPKYYWNTDQANADPAFAAAVSGLTNYGSEANLKIAAWSAHVGAPRSDNGDGVCIPTIVSDITYKGEGGSLRFVWKNQTGMSTGELLMNIDGSYGSAANSKMVNPTFSALSTKLYMKFAMRVDSTMLGAIQEHTPIDTFTQACSTPAVDSPIVDIIPPAVTGAWVGKKVYFDWVPAQNWKFGFRTIVSVQSTTRFTLDASPTLPGFQGFNGSCWIEPDSGSELAGTKVAIIFGNPPNGTSASLNIETAMLRNQRASQIADDYMQGYGQRGQQGFGNQNIVGPVVANTWHVFDLEIEYLPSARDFYTLGAGSVILKSNSLTFPSELLDAHIFISGYGPRSPLVDSSKWVPGLYLITNVNTSTNELTLASSPTPSAAGTDGEGFFSTGSYGSLTAMAKNRVRIWMDGRLAVEVNDVRIGFSAFAQPYGHGQLSLSNAANWRDTTQIHADAFTWFSHLLFSTQPIPFDTALSQALSIPSLIFNISKGRVTELYNRVFSNDPANSALVLVVINSGGDTSEIIRDRDTLSDLLSGSSSEVTNANYVRKILTDSDLVAFSPDDINDWIILSIPDQSWTGVASGTEWTQLVVCYDPDTTTGTDSDLIPLTIHDFNIVPDGNVLRFNNLGFYKVS